jgi:hypothetical protein
MTRERKMRLLPTGTTKTVVKDGKEIEVKLTAEERQSNRKSNVAVFALNRLNKAKEAIRVFGQCCGDKYLWEQCTFDENISQIDHSKKILEKALNGAITNLTKGKAITAAGISL